MQQLIQQVQQLTADNAALNGRVVELQNVMQQQQQPPQQQPQGGQLGQLAADARAQENALRDARKAMAALRRYDTISEPWRTFEDHFRAWVTMNADPEVVGHVFLKLALYMAMKGRACEIVRIYKPDTTAFDQAGTIEAYLTLYRQIFMPVQETEASRVEYRNYIQGKQEDVASYLSTKTALWNNAFEEGHRAYSTLLDDAIEGMCNPVIQRLVRRANPANPEELRNVAIQAVANERWLYSKSRSESTTLDGLASVTLNQQYFRDEPMDGIASMSKITCFRCGNKGHKRPDCNVKLPGDGKGDQKGNPPRGGGRKAKPEDECFHCGKKGHFKAQCYRFKNEQKDKKKDSKKDNAGKQGNKSMEEEQEGNRFLEEVDQDDPNP